LSDLLDGIPLIEPFPNVGPDRVQAEELIPTDVQDHRTIVIDK
jgi:hypothetical protein